MVKTGRGPAAGGMAGTAICTKLATMSISCCVAGIAVGRRALVDAVDMATRTSHRGVSTGQFEGSQVVVETGRGPTAG